jgi:hypothetical protein
MLGLILLAIVSLASMSLLVFLFLKLNQTQITLIKYLTEANQSLLNQARAQDISALAGLNTMTEQQPDEAYISTEDREMAAYYASLASNTQLGEVEFDEEDMATLRAGL